MSKTRIIGLASALVVACAIGWLALAGRGTHDAKDPLPVASPDAVPLGIDAMDAPDVVRPPAMKPDRPGAPQTPSSPVASRPALPSIDMPFNQSMEVLEEAARNGDPVAACRLTAEISRCWNARQMVAVLPMEERQIERMAEHDTDAKLLDKRIDSLVKMNQTIDHIVAGCEGVEASLAHLVRYDGLAAAAGDPVARMRYLSATNLTSGVSLRHPELLEHYRTHAYSYFIQALEAGDLEILTLWHASTQFEDMSPLTFVLPEAWQAPGLVNAVMQHLPDSQRSTLNRHGLPTTEPTSEQQDEAAHIYARYFASAETPPPQARSKKDNLFGWSDDPARCNDLAQ